METHGPKKMLYFDGGCRVCSAAATHYVSRESYEHVDITKGRLPDGVSKEEAMNDVHLIDENGRVYKGADAVLEIMDEHRFWRVLARIGRLPGVHPLSRLLYRFVATHRYLLGRIDGT